MKKVRQWCGYGAALVVVTGCYVEPTRDEEQDAQIRKRAQSETHAFQLDNTTCRFTLSKGCFDGHVAAKTAFHIDGKQFFNADDLATRFKELINVQAAGKKLTEGTQGGSYDLKLLTALDNSSFVQGFSYDLIGPPARSGNVRSDGNFAIDDLPEGNYELRVQKSVKFTVSQTSNATLPNPDPAPGRKLAADATATPASSVKVYCATLYMDSNINVRPGARQGANFDDFRMHLTDDQCMNGGNQTVLNL